MYTNSTTRSYASQRIDWSTRTDLSVGARHVAAILDRTGRFFSSSWFSAGRIADALGMAVSTVRLKLRELELRGLVSIVKDYGLKTRRRVVLLWREQPQPQTDNEGAVSHDPPAPIVHAERAPDPSPPQGGQASAEEVAAILKQASSLGNPSRRWVSDSCQAYGARVVAQAVAYAVRKGKRRFGWAVEAAKAWAVEGVPEYALSEAERVESEVAAIFAAFGPPAAPRPAPAPVPAFVEPVRVRDGRSPHLAWAASDNAFLRRLAAKAMKDGA